MAAKTHEQIMGYKADRKELADLLKLEIIAHLGNFCYDCFSSGDEVELEVNHIEGCTWNQRSSNRNHRWLKYLREIQSGVPINLLCRECNGGYNPKRYGKHGRKAK